MSDERKNNISEKEKEDILEIYKQCLKKSYKLKENILKSIKIITLSMEIIVGVVVILSLITIKLKLIHMIYIWIVLIGFNSIYGMSRSLIISTFLMIPCTCFAGIWWKSLFEIMDSIAFKEIMVIVELGMVWIFYKRSKRFAKIKVRVIMRYYSHAIKSK